MICVDDRLTSALTTKPEIFCFSNYDRATVKRTNLNAEKPLASVKIEAVTNELILGVAGIS